MWFSCRHSGLASRRLGLSNQAARRAGGHQQKPPHTPNLEACRRHHDSGHVAVRLRVSYMRVLNTHHTKLKSPHFLMVLKPEPPAFAHIFARDAYSRKRNEAFPTPDAKERTGCLTVPYIASLESAQDCPTLSNLLDTRIDGAWPGRERERALFFRELIPGRGARAAPPPRARSVPSARPLARCFPSLLCLALRGVGVAPEFKRTGVVGGKATACREPRPLWMD